MFREEYFKIQHSQYLKKVAKSYFSDNWIYFVLPILMCFSLGAINVNFIIVALMLLFVAAPMVLNLIYFYYMLTVEASWSVTDKVISVDKDGNLTLSFANENRLSKTIKREEIAGVTGDADSVILLFAIRKYTFLVIPYSHFISKDAVADFVAIYRS